MGSANEFDIEKLKVSRLAKPFTVKNSLATVGVEVACSVLPSERESAQLRVECTTRLHLDSAGSRIVSWISS